jgi:hypothetical protein
MDIRNFFKRGANEESVVDSNTKKSNFVDDSEGSQCSSELVNLDLELLEESESTDVTHDRPLSVTECTEYIEEDQVNQADLVEAVEPVTVEVTNTVNDPNTGKHQQNLYGHESISSSCFDIGQVLKKESSLTKTLKNMTAEHKYTVLTNHYQPPENFQFPKSQLHGCRRSCSKTYLDSNFVYSKSKDSVYCITCALFVPADKRNTNMNVFVNVGCKQWHHIKEKKDRHCETRYHQKAFLVAEMFKTRFENPKQTLPNIVDKTKKDRDEKYAKILEYIARAVHFCGRQGIALRGHRIDLADNDVNPGNFIALLEEFAEHDPLLKGHLENPLQKNARYVNWKSQNELIEIIGKKIIQASIIEEINKSGFHAVQADEVTVSNNEILSICVRFVDDEKNIREEFLEFIDLDRITGEVIGNSIIKFYQEAGLEVSDLRGQCYDGAANMQSEKKGVASVILKVAPRSPVMHCNSHNLNLVLASSCQLTTIQNIVAEFKSLINFFNTAPKPESLLEHIVQKSCHHINTRKVLISMCKTCWSQRDISYEHFYLAIPFIVTAFEVTNGSYGNLEEFDPLFTTGWDAETKGKATSFLKSVTDFGFIIGTVALYRLLHPLAGITNKLQGRSIDIVKAYLEIDESLLVRSIHQSAPIV